MSAGFCSHCGLQIVNATAAKRVSGGQVHGDCVEAYEAEQAAAEKRPATQLDRIEGKLDQLKELFNREWGA